MRLIKNINFRNELLRYKRNIGRPIAVKFLNSIIEKSSWRSLKHIMLKDKLNTVAVDDIFIPINKHNYVYRNQIIKILKCRFGEVLQNYEHFLIASCKLCLNQKKYYKKPQRFVYCIVQQYESIKYSKSMLQQIYSALHTLKIIRKRPDIKTSSIELFLTSVIDFIENLSEKFPSNVMFFDMNGNCDEKNASEFLNNTMEFDYKVVDKYLQGIKSYNVRFCVIDRKPLDSDSLTQTLFELNIEVSKSPLDEEVDQLFTEMNRYCESVMEQDIKNMGF